VLTAVRRGHRGSGVSAPALGVLAVIGMVVAFSLSSTLVKRAESPGVLVAFWRMVTVSLVTVFGSSGAVVVTLATAALPVALNARSVA